MPVIRVDPDEVVRFANDLQGVSVRIGDETAVMMSAFQDLREQWNDSRYEAFARNFEECARMLRSFCGEADLYADFLREKARLAEEYLYR